MNLWYLFGGIFAACICAPHLLDLLKKLPQTAQNIIAAILFAPMLLGMVWAFWFLFTGQVDPSFNSDYIKR
jgi:hypothetical protein